MGQSSSRNIDKTSKRSAPDADELLLEGIDSDNDDRTLLINASVNGYTIIVKKLLSNGINPNVVDDDNQTSLYRASEKGHLEIVKILLLNRADPNIANKAHMDIWK